MAASQRKIGVIFMIPLDIHLLPNFCTAASGTHRFSVLGSK
jgi:hypothetical protein